ncbi:Hpt domain-containing protein [Pelomonas sp. SE-A7]|uniref:hybrid sensor histidine kinase/response regulator n=1 Tax=Pelomonas sp. SE-A7 TaxID=3054953 RepID=UPI00259C8552|nr:Hpt domain-containing protein [Pelomonas sp. SE-A7]MDM4767621.1 Hpt domain-containing protein [Pelomonas sp. SE-A7]
MDLARESEFPADLSPLAWVQEELRRSLEGVHKSLRRLLRDGDTRISTVGFDAKATPSQSLTHAAAQLHQVAGVLTLVGLPAGATMLRAAEKAVSFLAANPIAVDLMAVETIERANFALLSLIAKMLAGGKPSSLSLFPSYRALQDFNNVERIHPADLWQFDWDWRDLRADAPPVGAAIARPNFEAALLKHMRQPSAGNAGQLSELCAGLAAGAGAREPRGLWMVAAAMFEAESLGLLGQDAYVKRLGSRLLAQLRQASSGMAPDAQSAQLARDLLFFCAMARAPEAGQAPRLQAVRQAYQLGDEILGDYEDESLGRIDPAWVAQARRRVGVAKESWSVTAEGESHRLAGLDEQFAAVSDSLGRLFPSGEVLGETLQRAVVATLRSGKPPTPALAMEIATAILYLEAALDDAAFDSPDQAARVKRLASRIEAVAHGDAPQPLEAWMEELYRRVSDRQTLGSVVHELRHSLSDVEKRVDDYFRDPAQRELLIPVPGLLGSMRGVLKVLGLDQAAQCCLRMRDVVDELANTEVDAASPAARARFEGIANNLGALGFLIDMLSVQPQLAKRMFGFDEESGVLAPVMGRSSDVAPSVSLPELTITGETTEILPRFETPEIVLDFPAPEGVAPAPQVVAPPPAPTPPAAPAQFIDEPMDEEMLGIFLEEASEVVGTARRALAKLEKEPQDREQLTTVRRAFHTLKGSSRMVGLANFGEAGWACEQLYNQWLTDEKPADHALQAFSREALDYFAGWAEAIQAGESRGHAHAAVRVAADALRLEGRLLGIAAPGAAAAAPVIEEVIVEAVAEPVAELLPEPVDVPEGIEVVELIEVPEVEVIEMPALPEVIDVGEPVEPVEAVEAIEEIEVVVPAEPPLVTETAPITDSQWGQTLPMEALPDLAPKLEPDLLLEPGPDLALDMVVLDLAPEPVAEPAPEPALAEGEAVELDLLSAAAPVEAQPPKPEAEPLPDFALDLQLGEVVTPAEPEVVVATMEPAAAAVTELLDLSELPDALPAPDLAEPVVATEPIPERTLALVPPPAGPEPSAVAEAAAEDEEDSVKVIGPLRISITLFNIFLNEADEASRRLSTELAEWAVLMAGPPPQDTEALSHKLAGNAATVGYDELSHLARALEHALGRSQHAGKVEGEVASAFVRSAEEIRRLLHQFAAGFLKPADAELLQALNAYQPADVRQNGVADELLDDDEGDAPAVAAAPVEPVATVAVPMVEEFPLGESDQIDPELFPIFEEEAQDLLRQLHAGMRDWLSHPGDAGRAGATMRALHTFKGGARLCGAMQLGEQAHLMESAVEHLLSRGGITAADVQELQHRGDALEHGFEQLLARLAAPAPVAVVAPPPSSPPSAPPPAPEPVVGETAPAVLEAAADAPGSAAIDWSGLPEAEVEAGIEAMAQAQALVRVRGPVLERMAAQAGEVSIRRARMESELSQMKSGLLDLEDNLERLRGRLRELEVQAEAQIESRQEAARVASRDFDPLEFDRYTRFQELTRMMAEAVNDVATVQRSLQKNVQLGEDELAAQSRLTRELQDDLLRTRLVEFDSLAERLHRVVRQAARDAGKQARLEIVGGHTELDRSVLERMVGPFEHLLRNSVSHGIEMPEARAAAGKDSTGTLRVSVRQEGNEILVDFADDGAGLNLPRIRERGLQQGLIQADQAVSEQELMELIFAPGFSTAASVTELSGRGIGMDVVRAEVNTLGGYVDITSTPGQGAHFDVRLPLTTAVSQIVLLRHGEDTVSVPAVLMEGLRRVDLDKVEQAYASGQIELGNETLPMYWLGGLMGHGARGHLHGKHASIVVVHSAHQRLALHVDEVLGKQEVVIKNLGPQLRSVPGLAGISLLASGEVALIYNPVALANRYGHAAQELARQLPEHAAPTAVVEETLAPLVLVVDDSLTVRRVTQRLLEREGYRVELAKDGLEALEKLAGDELPSVVLSDIEMPRMDGFDLVRNLRNEERLAKLPVIMITSRIAQKHRDYAQELGVDHYLGKPYDEEQLLELIGRYTA